MRNPAAPFRSLVLVGTSGRTLAALLLWLGGRRRPRGPARPVLTRAFVTERLSSGVAGAVLMHAALNAGITFGGVSSNAAMGVVLGTATVTALAVAAPTRSR